MIKWSLKALKQAKGFPTTQRDLVDDTIKVLNTFPDNHHVSRLVDHKYDYKLTIHKHDIFFNYDGEIRIMNIQAKNQDEQS